MLTLVRSPMTSVPSCSIPLEPSSAVNGYTYLETMYHLMEIISRRLNPDVIATATYAQLVENCETVENLRKHACPHIQNKENCKTALDRLQYFAIRLHTAFVISVTCRPALRRDCQLDAQQKKALAERCKTNLTSTVRMFLAMHQLSVIPTRSWAFTYHGLSSALLLGILCETKADPEIRQLQGDLIAALSATAAKDASSPEPHVIQTDKDIELSGPLWRALTALKNMYDHGTVVGSFKREGDSSGANSGTRTPLVPIGSGGSGSQLLAGSNQQMRNIQSTVDPREDAALAMAEMQNGSSLQDLATWPDSNTSAFPSMTLNSYPRMPYTPQMTSTSNNSLDGMPAGVGVEPSQYMAPMDLYESIWGGKSTSCAPTTLLSGVAM